MLIWLAVTGAILGELPDLLGLYGHVVLHDHNNLYNAAHYGAIKGVIEYIPMCTLHLWLDSYTHEMMDRWSLTNEWVVTEIAMWAINVVLIIWFVKIIKRQLVVHRVAKFKPALDTDSMSTNVTSHSPHKATQEP